MSGWVWQGKVDPFHISGYVRFGRVWQGVVKQGNVWLGKA